MSTPCYSNIKREKVDGRTLNQLDPWQIFAIQIEKVRRSTREHVIGWVGPWHTTGVPPGDDYGGGDHHDEYKRWEGRLENSQLVGSLTQLARHLGDFTLRQMVKTEGRVWWRGGWEEVQSTDHCTGWWWGVGGYEVLCSCIVGVGVVLKECCVLCWCQQHIIPEILNNTQIVMDSGG